MTAEEFKDIEMLRGHFSKADKWFDDLKRKVKEKRGVGFLSIHKYTIEDARKDFGKIETLMNNIFEIVLWRVLLSVNTP